MTRLLCLATGCLLAAACSQPHADTGMGDVLAIGAVQGHAGRSPLEGTDVTIEGVVTGSFGSNLGGWFMQDAGDDDPRTSDALFVLSNGDDTVRAGDRLRVHGRVIEHGDGDTTLTALQPVELEVLERDAEVSPLALDGPPDDWERLEGMRVWIAGPLVISGHHELERRGVLLAGFNDRLSTPTAVARPGAPAQAVAEANASRSVLIDDAMASEDPGETWYLPDHAQTPRTGSVLTGVDAIVDQRFGHYRLQLLDRPTLRPAPRPAPPALEGQVLVAVLNLQNLFNGDGRGGGFPTDRGARSAAELEHQLDRLRATVDRLGPDILAVMELENDGYGPEASIAGLAAALDGDWRFIDTGEGPGSDVIRVGLLYRAGAVQPVGSPAILEGRPFDTRSRVPLAHAFRAGEGPAFTVVANHFKSKGCREAVGLNRDQDDGQGCWNALRTDSARRLAKWLDSDPTRSGTDLAVIVGDLNAYQMEDPVRLLQEAGWQDVFAGRDEVYSYVFQGQAGRLTQMLSSPAMAGRMRGAAVWNSNADEPAGIGYRAAGEEAPDGSPWRSSDHDPVLAGFDLREP